MRRNTRPPARELPVFTGLEENFFLRLTPHIAPQDEPGSTPFYSMALPGVRLLAKEQKIQEREAMIRCLTDDVWPLRFKANRGFLSANAQALLLSKHVAVIGCGGLGGALIPLLARFGIGGLTLCDCDTFEESNLNRQHLCREDRIGMNKALAAAQELALTASHVSTVVRPLRADSETLPAILEGAHIAVDCLDTFAARRDLEKAAHAARIPFVHGSVAGLEGFAMTCRPGENSLARLYGGSPPEGGGAEKKAGVPTPTPTMAAVLQTMLTVRELLGQADPFSSIWHMDLAALSLEQMRL